MWALDLFGLSVNEPFDKRGYIAHNKRLVFVFAVAVKEKSRRRLSHREGGTGEILLTFAALNVALEPRRSRPLSRVQVSSRRPLWCRNGERKVVPRAAPDFCPRPRPSGQSLAGDAGVFAFFPSPAYDTHRRKL